MRLAAIQVAIRQGSRSANLRAAITALEQAAEIEPAPDICVLPAMFNLIGGVAPTQSIAESLFGPTATVLASATRDLGLFVVYGIAALGRVGASAFGIFLDPDGDYLHTHIQTVHPEDEQRLLIPGQELQSRQSVLGQVAVLLRHELNSPDIWKSLGETQPAVVCGCLSGCSAGGSVDEIAALAAGAGRWTIVSDTSEVGSGRPGRTCIIHPDGRIIAKATGEHTQVIVIRTSRV